MKSILRALWKTRAKWLVHTWRYQVYNTEATTIHQTLLDSITELSNHHLHRSTTYSDRTHHTLTSAFHSIDANKINLRQFSRTFITRWCDRRPDVRATCFRDRLLHSLRQRDVTRPGTNNVIVNVHKWLQIIFVIGKPETVNSWWLWYWINDSTLSLQKLFANAVLN